MQGVIFELEEIKLWKIVPELKIESQILEEKINPKQYFWDSILKTLKSYRPSPKGNGIKWSKEEKEAFMKLHLQEQRKMIVRKSELKSVLFPYVNVDYTPYTFSERISDSAKRAYTKATKLLESYAKKDFNLVDSKIQNEILHNLRLAYKEQYLKAGVKLSQLLFKKAALSGNDESKKQIQECAKITKDLLPNKIPENAYMYYQLYKWSIDNNRIFNAHISPSTLGLVREEALECYNYALESIVWEAIDEEAQREELSKTMFAAELYLAAGIKYQSPLAFYLAADNYAPSGLTSEMLKYALIPYNACLRCSIALGNLNALETLKSNYENGTRMMRKSLLTVKLLESYMSKRELINGLDPYFDERFPPELIIDLGRVFAMSYGGTVEYPGISRLIKGENYYQITIKDPRDRDSTPQSIKEYYLRVWEMLVSVGNTFPEQFNSINLVSVFCNKIYSNLTYGYPSARPYIFPKEVLDMEIDFTKGLEGYGKEMDQEMLEKLFKENLE